LFQRSNSLHEGKTTGLCEHFLQNDRVWVCQGFTPWIPPLNIFFFRDIGGWSHIVCLSVFGDFCSSDQILYWLECLANGFLLTDIRHFVVCNFCHFESMVSYKPIVLIYYVFCFWFCFFLKPWFCVEQFCIWKVFLLWFLTCFWFLVVFVVWSLLTRPFFFIWLIWLFDIFWHSCVVL